MSLDSGCMQGWASSSLHSFADGPLQLQTDGASCNSVYALRRGLCPSSTERVLRSGLSSAEVSHDAPSQEPQSHGNCFSKEQK